MRKLLVMSILLVLSVSAFAEDFGTSYESRIKDYNDLVNAKKIKLTVDKGSTAKWENGKLKISNSKWTVEQGGQFIIEDINLDKRTATMVGKNGKGNMSVYQTSSGLHFTEFTSSGSPFYLTVYSRRISPTKYCFVYSRHMKITYEPLPSQWYGECEILK